MDKPVSKGASPTCGGSVDYEHAPGSTLACPGLDRPVASEGLNSNRHDSHSLTWRPTRANSHGAKTAINPAPKSSILSPPSERQRSDSPHPSAPSSSSCLTSSTNPNEMDAHYACSMNLFRGPSQIVDRVPQVLIILFAALVILAFVIAFLLPSSSRHREPIPDPERGQLLPSEP